MDEKKPSCLLSHLSNSLVSIINITADLLSAGRGFESLRRLQIIRWPSMSYKTYWGLIVLHAGIQT